MRSGARRQRGLGSGRAVAAWLLAALLLGAPAGAERIRSFDALLELSESGAFGVTETLRYDFGDARRHGIYRDIPVRYGRGRAPDYRVAIDVEAVTDEAGRDLPYRTSREGRNLRIRIGEPDRVVSGLRTYRIRYRVERGILFFANRDELYWNVTGTDWNVPVDRAVAELRLPAGAADTEIELACFTGPMGSVESACAGTPRGDAVRFASTRALASREGLSVVVGLPKGVLREPTALERFAARAREYLSAWLLLPLATLSGMYAAWRAWGRDPRVLHAIPVRYEPPEGMRPAEVGTVHDESADVDDLTSTLLDLAVRGHLEIEEVEGSGFLFLSSRDYVLRRTGADPAELVRHERALMDALFDGGRTSVLVSELRNRFYAKLPDVRDALYARVVREDGLFPTSPRRVRRRWAQLGAGIAVLSVTLIFGLKAPFEPAAAAALCGGILLGFARFMPRRTRKGRDAFEHILGFKEFLERVDADRLERSGGRSAGRFERILPYAVVLGAADQWAGAFRDIYTQPPAWFRSHRYDGRFHTRAFVEDLGSCLRTTGSTMTSTPRSRGSGSSGFGGGGFSGGGFGGGGGGSW